MNATTIRQMTAKLATLDGVQLASWSYVTGVDDPTDVESIARVLVVEQGMTADDITTTDSPHDDDCLVMAGGRAFENEMTDNPTDRVAGLALLDADLTDCQCANKRHIEMPTEFGPVTDETTMNSPADLPADYAKATIELSFTDLVGDPFKLPERTPAGIVGDGPEIGVAPAMAPKFRTREEWLRAAIEVFRPWFSLINRPLPAAIRISCGWGATGARSENSVILGVTLRRDLAADDVSEIFISPEDADAISMLETVLHELIHVQDNIKSGHKGDFVVMAKAFGFTKPWTETPPGWDLTTALRLIAEDLGTYPGARVSIPSRRSLTLDPSMFGGPTSSGGPIKVTSAGTGQSNRHVLLKCAVDGYQVRTTKRWIEVGLPMCPVGHTMGVV